MKPFYTIYMLIDPRDHRPFYIGQTSNIHLRYYKQHWNPNNNDHSDCAKTIRAILKAGRKPDLVILETATRKTDALMLEMYWIIALMKSRMTLKNREAQRWLSVQYDALMKQVRSKQPRPPRVKQPEGTREGDSGLLFPKTAL